MVTLYHHPTERKVVRPEIESEDRKVVHYATSNNEDVPNESGGGPCTRLLSQKTIFALSVFGGLFGLDHLYA